MLSWWKGKLSRHILTVPDPRVQGRCLHKLSDILFIALCTVLSNGEDSIDVVAFGEAKREWLEKVIEFPNGILSDDTFRRVLLDELDIQGSIVSINAMGCQIEIAKKIKSKQADYLLSVKANQAELHEEISEIFDYASTRDYNETWEYDHGRYDQRQCSILSARQTLSPNLKTKWPNVRTIIKITAQRTIEDVTTTNTK